MLRAKASGFTKTSPGREAELVGDVLEALLCRRSAVQSTVVLRGR